jgi:diguanylate cyclase
LNAAPHILVVDDNATNRKLVSTLLGFDGFRVSEAADGAEALDVARSVRPQLVISDILMPTMDGYEFVRQLRADKQVGHLPVIFYTANYHEREALVLAQQCGVARVLTKPSSAPVLLQAVREVLQGTRQPQEIRAEVSFDLAHLRLVTDKLSQKADALRRANSRLAALTELNLQLASEQDPQRLLDSACTSARRLLGARFAALAVTDGTADGRTGCVSGLPADAAASFADPQEDQGPLGAVFRERATLRHAVESGSVELGLPACMPAVRSALAAPVCSLTRTYGWLCLGDKLGAVEFDAEDERLLSIVGAQLGRIYENGRLYREVQEHSAHLLVQIEERERAATQLRASEERFRELAENIQDVFFIADAQMLLTTYVSPGYERVWGRPVEGALLREDGWLDTVVPADRDMVKAEVRRVVAAFPDEGQFEFRIRRPDGAQRWVLTRIFPILAADGTVMRTVGVSKDITGRKQSELRIERLNRTHAMLSGINSLIVRATDRAALLREACELAVETGGFRAAWCGIGNEDSASLKSAFAGKTAQTHEIRVKLDALAQQAGLMTESMRTRQPTVCHDLATAPAAWQPLLECGGRSMVALPLLVAGEAQGCFVLLADEPDYFDDEEMRLLRELAEDISFSLDHIDKAEQLDYLAAFNPVTGLPNRMGFEQCVNQFVGMAHLTRLTFAVVIADLERFEALNNTLGRATGDAVLRLAGQRFAEAAGGKEVSGHIGSDQFTAILSLPADGAGLSRQLEELWARWLGTPFEVDGHRVELSAKAGVALYPADGQNGVLLLEHAEAALRDAKQGLETFAFYEAHMSERFTERLELERSLRRAIENEEFVLHYQPKVDLQQRRVLGLEALIRWQRPGIGLVSPANFIPVLEETGLICEVGAWALRRACEDRQRLRERGVQAPRIAVNVSAVQLRRENFVHLMQDALRGNGGDAGLDIEVTESLLMESIVENLVKLEAVRELGVGIALDDFGTGYSSLGYLAKLPVETLKIDRTFVTAMLDDPSAMTLVSTIISLARSLKLQTVAEGVESEEQAKILRLIGCDQMQGYLIAPALPLEEIAAFLASQRA